jgi:Ca-activated chloride channel homolog
MYLQASDADQLGEALAQTVPVAVEPEREPKPDAPPPPEASLSAEDTVEQAAMFPVTWEGPGDRYDSIQIFDPQAVNGEGKVVRSATLTHGDMEKRQVSMAAPAKLGGFMLRYWNGENKAVLATRALRVE